MCSYVAKIKYYCGRHGSIFKTTRSIHFIISIACLHYCAGQVYVTVHASIRIEHSSRPQRHWRPYDRRCGAEAVFGSVSTMANSSFLLARTSVPPPAAGMTNGDATPLKADLRAVSATGLGCVRRLLRGFGQIYPNGSKPRCAIHTARVK
jgi:hypothetical protein